MDEFIAEAMRTDLKFNTLAEELQYLIIMVRQSRQSGVARATCPD